MTAGAVAGAAPAGLTQHTHLIPRAPPRRWDDQKRQGMDAPATLRPWIGGPGPFKEESWV